MTNERKRGASTRREAEAIATEAKLQELGRVPHYRDYAMNVRTVIWVKPGDRNVPALIEQMRLYSTYDDFGTSRGMESSDMGFVVGGLDTAKEIIKHWKLPLIRPRTFSRSGVLAAVDRGDNPPLKTIVNGNAAALLWGNEADDDIVFNTELLVLHPEPYGLDRFFFAAQIPDVRNCYFEASVIIHSAYDAMRRREGQRIRARQS